MVNFLLPQLNTEQPNYAGSFMQGLQVPYAFQQMQTRQELLNAQLEERKAEKDYAKTGDINALRGAPKLYFQAKVSERKEKHEEKGLQEAGLKVAEKWIPLLLANPDPNTANQMAGMLLKDFKFPSGSIPFFKTPEEVTAYATKVQEAMLKPGERLARQLKAPDVKEVYDPVTGLKRKMEWSPGKGWQPLGGLEKDKEEGLIDRPKALYNYFKKVNRGKEPTHEDLKQIAEDFYQRGLALETQEEIKYLERATALVKDSLDFQQAKPDEKLDIISDMAKKLRGKGAGKSTGKTPSPTSGEGNKPWWWQ